MALGMAVGLGVGHTAQDMDSAPHSKNGAAPPPIFCPFLGDRL